MNNTELDIALLSIKSFQEYEKFKLKKEVLEKIAEEIIDRHQLPKDSLALFSDGTNIVFAHDEQRVIKIYPPFHQDQFQSELLVLQHLLRIKNWKNKVSNLKELENLVWGS